MCVEIKREQEVLLLVASETASWIILLFLRFKHLRSTRNMKLLMFQVD